MREVGPSFAVGPTMPDDCWHYLKSHGGDWMWDKFYGTPSSKNDLSWLVAAVRNGTVIWVTDGSYDRKHAPTVSGTGWTSIARGHANSSSAPSTNILQRQGPTEGSFLDYVRSISLCLLLKNSMIFPQVSSTVTTKVHFINPHGCRAESRRVRPVLISFALFVTPKTSSRQPSLTNTLMCTWTITSFGTNYHYHNSSTASVIFMQSRRSAERLP